MKVGDTVYVVLSNAYVREGKIEAQRGPRYSVRIPDEHKCLYLPPSRLFTTYEEARASIIPHATQDIQLDRHTMTFYDEWYD